MEKLIITFVVLSIGAVLSNPILEPPIEPENFEEKGDFFEGDMIFPHGFDPTQSDEDRGVGIIGPRRWPDNIIPYDVTAITDASHRNLIQTAVRTIENVTSIRSTDGSTILKPCVTFRPRISSDTAYVKIQYGTGCSASVGYVLGQRSMTLQNSGCFRLGTIQHEFLHILGLYHEQSRPDRDEHITVHYANIEPGKEHNFNKYVWGVSVIDLETPYDYGSIMHYSAYSFSANTLPTITTKQAGATIGQREQLSATDIEEVRRYYQCHL